MELLTKNSPIDSIGRCECGAMTIFFTNGGQVSMSEETFEKITGTVPNKEDKYIGQLWCNCNHCVNHWGIDLCVCGSGVHPDECDCFYKGYAQAFNPATGECYGHGN